MMTPKTPTAIHCGGRRLRIAHGRFLDGDRPIDVLREPDGLRLEVFGEAIREMSVRAVFEQQEIGLGDLTRIFVNAEGP